MGRVAGAVTHPGSHRSGRAQLRHPPRHRAASPDRYAIRLRFVNRCLRFEALSPFPPKRGRAAVHPSLRQVRAVAFPSFDSIGEGRCMSHLRTRRACAAAIRGVIEKLLKLVSDLRESVPAVRKRSFLTATRTMAFQQDNSFPPCRRRRETKPEKQQGAESLFW
jgi:hypothetical protein